MRSIRGSCTLAVVLVVSHGCDTGDTYWPPATQAVVKDLGAPRVLATVPIEQRKTTKRRSLAIRNETPVIVLDDPAYRALARNTSGFQSPEEPVLVRITKGVDQGRELIVRRQDLAPGPEPRQGLLSLVTVCLFTLIGAAAALSTIETLVLKLRARRESNLPDARSVATGGPGSSDTHANQREASRIAVRENATSGSPRSRLSRSEERLGV